MVGVALEEIDAEHGTQGSLFAHLSQDDPLDRLGTSIAFGRIPDTAEFHE